MGQSRKQIWAWVSLGLLTFLLFVGMVVALYRTSQNSQHIEANGNRSCLAIKGTTNFYKEIRNHDHAELSDPKIGLDVRLHDQKMVDALDKIIKLAESLPC